MLIWYGRRRSKTVNYKQERKAMEQILIAVGAFSAGFLLGNITKLELRAILRRVVVWLKGRKK